MQGPYRLDPLEIFRVETGPGAYLLANQEGHALFVGRASNLQMGLGAHLDQLGNIPLWFWYEPTGDIYLAYRLECGWYHQFVPTRNAGHPARLLGTHAGCGVCGRVGPG